MKKVKLHILAALGAMLAFWACSSGELEWVDNDDVLAMEKFDKLGEAEVLGIMKECLGKPECRAEMNSDLAHELENCDGDPSCEEEFINNHLRKPVEPDTVEEDPDTLSSSSSVIEISSSSSLLVLSSSSLELSSSSELDTLSSSSVPESSSQALSSSVVESSSTVVSSSSFVFKSSSSMAKSSSSLLLLSSSEESSSSTEDPCTEELLGAGSCKVTPLEIDLGGEATWRYIPAGPECGGFTGKWKLPEADHASVTGPTATYKFSDEDVLDGKDYVKVFPELTVTRGGHSVEIDCSGGSGQLKIKKASAPESSSSVKPESSSSLSSSSVKSSSSTVPITDECAPDPMTDDMMCQKPGRTNERCVQNSQNKWVCPTGQSSSSVTPPPESSSSEEPPPPESSSSEEPPPPSSSSQESSSSQGPSGPTFDADKCAQYCPTVGCSNYENVPYTGGWAQTQNHCIFVTTKPNAINNGDCSVKINGTSITGYKAAASLPDSEIGFYIEATGQSCYWTME